MRNHGTFLGEAFDVLSFPGEITQRNEQGKIGVAMTGSANQRVELSLHVFPDPVAPRTNDHATADVRRLGQFGGPNHLLIPLGKIFVASRRYRGLWILWICHRKSGVSQKRPTIVEPLCQSPRGVFTANDLRKQEAALTNQLSPTARLMIGRRGHDRLRT